MKTVLHCDKNDVCTQAGNGMYSVLLVIVGLPFRNKRLNFTIDGKMG